MSTQTLLVILDPNHHIIAVADPATVPPGMSYSIACCRGASVLEVDVPHQLMQRPHPEMKRVIIEQIRAGASRPHRPKSPSSKN
jgi:hypothetical protein